MIASGLDGRYTPGGTSLPMARKAFRQANQKENFIFLNSFNCSQVHVFTRATEEK